MTGTGTPSGRSMCGQRHGYDGRICRLDMMVGRSWMRHHRRYPVDFSDAARHLLLRSSGAILNTLTVRD